MGLSHVPLVHCQCCHVRHKDSWEIFSRQMWHLGEQITIICLVSLFRYFIFYQPREQEAFPFHSLNFASNFQQGACFQGTGLLRMRVWPSQSHSRLSSLEPTILLACGRNRELWEQPFQACAIDADCVKPDGQNSVIFFVISKWLLPELSSSDRWSRGKGLWERDWVRACSQASGYHQYQTTAAVPADILETTRLVYPKLSRPDSL